ncbi:nuclear pore complex protein NUP93A [Tanacetum coccineum]
MANDGDTSSWTNLLHLSSKLVEQAAPSAQFPPLLRNLDQLEALSKELKSKTLRTEAPSQSIGATRLLAREGINAEQLARDFKSLELKTTFEDVFPAEATSVEEYLQQVHEMAMVSAVQEAKKDNHRKFSDYMMTVLESWGRLSCARAMIELRADTKLKETLVVAVPKIESDGYILNTIRIESELKPPRCSSCKNKKEIQIVMLRMSMMKRPDSWLPRRIEPVENSGHSVTLSILLFAVELVDKDDWRKEKRDFLHSMNRISTLPRTNLNDSSFRDSRSGQKFTPVPIADEPADEPADEKKVAAYANVVRTLNAARHHATAFKDAYESLGLDSSGGKSLTMSKIWHLVQTLMGENSSVKGSVSKKMSLMIGARRHLEWGHEKYIMEMIQRHPVQAALPEVVGNLQRIHAFLRIRLKDYGVLDFDAGDAHRKLAYDTTWQQIYFCLRTGYYDAASDVASRCVSDKFALQLAEWITNGGTVSVETASIAAEECEKMLRMGDRAGQGTFDKKKLFLYALISGSRKQIDFLLREQHTLFNTIEDFLWFKLCAVRDSSGGSSSAVLNEGLSPYNLDDLQAHLNKYEPSYYTKNGKDPLVYPYVLLLSIQLVPAVRYLSKDIRDDGYNVDAAHIAIVLADHGVLSDSTGTGHELGVMDYFTELARQYGSLHSRLNNLSMALEYYVQAAVIAGGGQLSWSGRATVDQQMKRTLLMEQLLMEILLCDGGILLLLGPSGTGEEGELQRFLMEPKDWHQFLFDAARQCQEAGPYDKVNSISFKKRRGFASYVSFANNSSSFQLEEIQKRIGVFSIKLDTINKGLSDTINKGLSAWRSRAAAGLVHSGNELLEEFKNHQNISPQEREIVSEQETLFRQLEKIFSIQKSASQGHDLAAIWEVAALPFLRSDLPAPETRIDMLHNLSPYLQACVSDLLKVSLQCINNVVDTDGSLPALRTKITDFLATISVAPGHV